MFVTGPSYLVELLVLFPELFVALLDVPLELVAFEPVPLVSATVTSVALPSEAASESANNWWLSLIAISLISSISTSASTAAISASAADAAAMLNNRKMDNKEINNMLELNFMN